MMNRVVGLLVSVTWAVAFAALMARDVVPLWLPQDPPRGEAPGGNSQVGLFDASGRRVGTSWMTVHAQPQLTTITSSTELSDVAPLRAVAALPWVLIDSTFVFTQPDGRLLNFEVVLRRPGESIGEVRGQLVGDDYACSARAGAATWDFSVDARISSLLGDSLRPFTHLPNLRVGQCWRLQSVDPLSLLAGKPAAVHARLVRVVAREEIEHAGRRVGCFRIETEGVTAWADERGRVLLQRVTLPILGTWELRDEPFDGEARRRARHTADPASADAGGSARSQGLICVAGGSR